MGTLTDLTNRVIENCALGKIGLQDVVANDVLDNPVTIAQGLNFTLFWLLNDKMVVIADFKSTVFEGTVNFIYIL